MIIELQKGSVYFTYTNSERTVIMQHV